MTTQLENEFVTAIFTQQGAELISLKSKKNQLEYIWQGDAKFWGRHAPVLFPFVGRLQGNCYHYDGVTYSMNQHGFARDCQFEVIKKDQDAISFLLSSNEETKKTIPLIFN